MRDWNTEARILNLIYLHLWISLFSSVQFSCSVVSDSLRPHESQHARPPCPSPSPRVHSDSRPSSQWCHPAISSSVVPFSSCPQSLPASECSGRHKHVGRRKEKHRMLRKSVFSPAFALTKYGKLPTVFLRERLNTSTEVCSTVS